MPGAGHVQLVLNIGGRDENMTYIRYQVLN